MTSDPLQPYIDKLIAARDAANAPEIDEGIMRGDPDALAPPELRLAQWREAMRELDEAAKRLGSN